MVDAAALAASPNAPSLEAGARRSAALRVALAVGVGAWLLGAAWSLMTPVMGAYDENQHFIKAVSVWHGQLRGTSVEIPGQSDDALPQRVDVVRVPEDDASLQQVHGCFVGRGQTPDCAPAASGDHDRSARAGTAAGPYPPLYYALVGWPSRLVSAPLDLYLMRLVSAAWSAAFVALALSALRRMTSSAVAVTATAVAMVPMVWFLAGVVNPNGLEISAALAMWATWMLWADDLARGTPSQRWLVVGAVVSAVVLGNCRSLGPGLVFLVAATTWLARRPSIRAWRSALRVLVPVGVGTSLGALWVIGEGHLDAIRGTKTASGGPIVWELLRMVPEWVMQTFADVGWGEIRVRPVAALCLAAMVVFVLLARRHGARREATLALALLGAVVVAPVALQLPSAGSGGIAWQGRYLLAALVGVPVLCGAAFGRTEAGRDVSLAGWWHRAGIVAAVGWLGTLAVAGAHYGAGPFGNGNWSPPLGMIGVLVVAAAGTRLLLGSARAELT